MNPTPTNLWGGLAIGWQLQLQSKARREAVQPEREEKPDTWTDLPPLLAVTLESAQDGIVTVDCSGKVICYNSRFVALWGIPSPLLHRGTYAELMAFAAERTHWPEQFLRRERDTAWSEEGLDVVRLRDGRIFKRQIQPQLIGGDYDIRVVSFRDITQGDGAESSAAPVADFTDCPNQPRAGNRAVALEFAREITGPAQYVGDNLRFLLDCFRSIQHALEIYPELLTAAKTQAVPPELIARATAALPPEDLKFFLEQVPTALHDTTVGLTKILDGVRTFDALGRQSAQPAGVPA